MTTSRRQQGTGTGFIFTGGGKRLRDWFSAVGEEINGWEALDDDALHIDFVESSVHLGDDHRIR